MGMYKIDLCRYRPVKTKSKRLPNMDAKRV